MAGMSAQAPRRVVMIRPRHFTPNPATARENSFQGSAAGKDAAEIAASAYREVSELALVLEEHGIEVHLFDENTHANPDAVFPNNWFSTHAGGQVAIYPMASPSRRGERRGDVIELLKHRYRVQEVIDYSGLEQDGVFLEGTGGMVLDHIERVAYAARSNRVSDVALERFCAHFNFEPVIFDASDGDGCPVYHTNVLMSLGTDIALVGMDLIRDLPRRAEILARLGDSGRGVIALSPAEIGAFAGNAIELCGRDGLFLAMSRTGERSLAAATRARIAACLPIVAIDVPTIELAGGSVRCMIAGIHLSPRPNHGRDAFAEHPPRRASAAA